MIFIDSSYLIAIAIKHDKWHKRAMELIEKIEKEEKIISTFHISETITMIGKKSNGEIANHFYNYIKQNYKIIDGTLDLCNKTMPTYLKYSGKLSIADTLAIKIMKKHEIHKIASFDSDFDKVKKIVRIK